MFVFFKKNNSMKIMNKTQSHHDLTNVTSCPTMKVFLILIKKRILTLYFVFLPLSFVGNTEIDIDIKRYYCKAGIKSIQVSTFLFV